MIGTAQSLVLRFCAGVILIAALAAGGAGAAERVTVYAAASLTDALGDVARDHTTRTGVRIVQSFAGSSSLARQIANGAPADIYISANPAWMDHLAERGLIVAGTRRDILGNRLVLIAPADRAGQIDIRPGIDLAARLDGGRLAMGDPDHVPAGIYGREALRHLTVWDTLRPRVARTADVRGALALVARRETTLGIVYATDASISDRVAVVGVFTPDSHTPIRYAAAIVAGRDRPDVRRFFDALSSPEALERFQAHGFAAP